MSQIENLDVKWTDAKELVLKGYAEESQCLYITYTKEYIKYRNLGYLFTIPNIIISTVIGLLAFDQNFTSSPNGPFIIGGSNIFVAIIGTIYKVLKYGDYESQFKFLGGEHLKLYAEIQAMLVKSPEEREHPLEYIRKIENRRLQLIDDAPVISDQTKNKFKRKYKNQVDELPVLLEKINKVKIYGKPTENQKLNSSLISESEIEKESRILQLGVSTLVPNKEENNLSEKEIVVSILPDTATSAPIKETSLSASEFEV